MPGRASQVLFASLSILFGSMASSRADMDTKAAPRADAASRRIANLYDALASNSFAERARATGDLVAIGETVVPVLLQLLPKASPEQSVRIVNVFERLGESKQPKAAQIAIAGLTQAIGSANRAAAKEAATTLTRQQAAAAVRIAKAGGGLETDRDGVVCRVLQKTEPGHDADATAANLRWFPSIRSVSMEGSTITDSGLRSLESLPKLERLNLNWCRRLSDDSLTSLQSHTSLIELYLEGTQTSALALKSIASCSDLRVLVLNYTVPGENALAELEGCKSLKILSLRSVPVANDGLASVAKLELLQDLTVWAPGNSSFTDDGVSVLASKLKDLRSLSISSTRVTDTVLAELSKLPRLKRLDMPGCAVKGNKLAVLNQSASLEVLSFRNSTLDDGSIDALTSIANLREIDVAGTRITNAGIETIRKRLPRCFVNDGSAD